MLYGPVLVIGPVASPQGVLQQVHLHSSSGAFMGLRTMMQQMRWYGYETPASAQLAGTHPVAFSDFNRTVAV